MKLNWSHIYREIRLALLCVIIWSAAIALVVWLVRIGGGK